MHSFCFASGAARILIAASGGGMIGELRSLLEQQGHSVEICCDGKVAAERVIDPHLDLILLESELAEVDGWQLLERVREYRSTPVILLAGPGASREDRIAAFEGGADDFLINPVDLVELRLRADVLLRRSARVLSAPEQLRLGPLLLSRADQTVRFGQIFLTFTPIQFKLLWSLAQRHKEVLSRAYLHQLVLGKHFCQHDRSVDMHLSRVRRKLVTAGMAADCLMTVRGQGYCLTLEQETFNA